MLARAAGGGRVRVLGVGGGGGIDLGGLGGEAEIMTKKIKYINIAEFRAVGFLQEVNRQFFHPLGLALEVRIDDDGNEILGGVWDYRDDPEGIRYDEVDAGKARHVEELQQKKAAERFRKLGYIIQSAG